MIAANDVSKRFEVGPETVVALDKVTLETAPGEFVCVYGASGSGKTTLLNVLAGIETPDEGTVSVGGMSLSGLSESARAKIRLKGIGVIFQANNLLPEVTASENVALPLVARGVARREVSERADAALTSLGLDGVGSRLPSLMSGGQRQRVGIARAFAGDQDVLLAEEPTGALDAQNSRQLFGVMRAMCDDHGKSVVLATHHPLAQGFADSIYVMVDGTLAPQ